MDVMCSVVCKMDTHLIIWKVLNIDVVIVSMILVIDVTDLFNFTLNSEGYITPIWWCIL